MKQAKTMPLYNFKDNMAVYLISTGTLKTDIFGQPHIFGAVV
jgi:hypothetical protein